MHEAAEPRAGAALPRVLVCCNDAVRRTYLDEAAARRLDAIAEWSWLRCEGTGEEGWGEPSRDPDDARNLKEAIASAQALLVCHGAPLVDDAILEAAPQLGFVGELEGDRFAMRVDLEAAAQRGVRVVDTTQGSSYPVAEWALGLMLIGLRNAAEHYRRMIAGDEYHLSFTDPAFLHGELTGKRVGLIGLGFIGRRLVELLRPFRCDVWAYDPYVPKEVAECMGVQLTSLEHVMHDPDVVVCCAPLTPRTRGMLGERELALLRPDSVFVNVSRGAIVDSDALCRRAAVGDMRFALDVFDPEPIPAASPIRTMSNVFLSPHIAGVTAAEGPRYFSLMSDELERFFHGHETMSDLTPRVMANRRGTTT